MMDTQPARVSDHRKINFRQTAVVAVYMAVCASLLTLLYFGFSTSVGTMPRRAFVLLAGLLAAVRVFDVPFPHFRLRIVNSNAEDITNCSRAQFIVMAGLLWRLAVLFIPLSLIFGLGGVGLVVLLVEYRAAFLLHAELIYPVSFLCFFTTHYIALYPLTFWWLRLRGRMMHVAVVPYPHQGNASSLDKNRA